MKQRVPQKENDDKHSYFLDASLVEAQRTLFDLVVEDRHSAFSFFSCLSTPNSPFIIASSSSARFFDTSLWVRDNGADEEATPDEVRGVDYVTQLVLSVETLPVNLANTKLMKSFRGSGRGAWRR